MISVKNGKIQFQWKGWKSPKPPLYLNLVGKTFKYEDVEFTVIQAINECECLIQILPGTTPTRESKFLWLACTNEIASGGQSLPYRLEREWLDRHRHAMLDEAAIYALATH